MPFPGFGMVKEALGDCAFYGRGEPQSFITDNCDAETKTSKDMAHITALYLSHSATNMVMAFGFKTWHSKA